MYTIDENKWDYFSSLYAVLLLSYHIIYYFSLFTAINDE